MSFMFCVCFFFFKQKTAYEMRISDWSSDVCSSDLFPQDDVARYSAPWAVIAPFASASAQHRQYEKEQDEGDPDHSADWKADFALALRFGSLRGDRKSVV